MIVFFKNAQLSFHLLRFASNVCVLVLAICVFSLLEKDDHRVTNVQADVATVIVRYRMPTFLNDEAVPVAFITSIEFFFNFSRNVGEVAWVVIFEGLEAGDDGVLLLLRRHVSALDQHLSVGVRSERV